MAKTKHTTLAVLDVGTSKVCCFIAVREEGLRPRVIGIGHQLSRGLKNGTVVDMAAVEESILNAVHQAEQMAGETIRTVTVNISGGAPKSHTMAVEVDVSSREVMDHDIRHVVDEGYVPYVNGVEHEMVHFIPTGFTLDGCEGIRDPRGMYGTKLGAHIHTVTTKLSALQNLKTCIRRCHLEVTDFVVSSYASGLAVLVEDELDLGATVIDIGGGITSIAVFENQTMIFTDSVPIGGQHVTNDIAAGLATPLNDAERLKTLHGTCLSSNRDSYDMIDVPVMGDDNNQVMQIQKAFLVNIIRPRMEELFELVRQRLETSGYFNIAGRRVVLTGGGSQLTGAADLCGMMLGKQVRVAKPLRTAGLADTTNGPAFSTCAGLLSYKMQPPSLVEDHLLHTAPTGFFGKVSHWLSENL